MFDYVERNPIFKDGKPHRTGYGGLYPLCKSDWTFYVDKDGTLREPKDRRPPWSDNKDNPNIIKTKDSSVFIIRRESDRTWFRVSLEDWGDHLVMAFVPDNPEWVINLLGQHNIGNKKVVLKTLSKREKRNLKLS